MEISEQVMMYGLDDPTEICLLDDGVTILRVSDVFKHLASVTAERDRAIVQLAEANEFVDRLGEFLLCVNQPHDYDCANYRDETKPCDCGYEELTKRFNEHRARVEREGNQCQKN